MEDVDGIKDNNNQASKKEMKKEMKGSVHALRESNEQQ